jgi:hypothetical protein
LDHVAWSLVEAGRRPSGTLTEKDQEAVAFPICTTRIAFNNAINRPAHPRRKSKLPGITRKQLALIRAYQPYRGGKRKAERHPLFALHYLSNRDKHRTIQLSGLRPYDIEFTIGAIADFVPTRFMNLAEKPIRAKEGAEIIRYYGRRTGPNPHMDVKISSSLEPEIEGRYWLADTYNLARSTIVSLMYLLAPTIR